MIDDGGICNWCGTRYIKYYPKGRTWWRVLFLRYSYYCPYCDVY